MGNFMITLLIYMCRWQLSTPIMSLVICFAKQIGVFTSWKEVAIANLVCAIPFFFLDRFIIVSLNKWIKGRLNKESKNV